MLTEEIRVQIGQAAKERDSMRVSTLRLLLSALEYKRMQKLADLVPEEEITVIKSEVKKRQEAIEIYEKAGEVERAAVEKGELAILRDFLPEQMGEEEVRKVVMEVKKSLGEGVNRGQVVGIVISKIGKEKVDGGLVARIVNEVVISSD